MNKGKVIIIAEAGVNHNGRVDIAKKLIDVAKLAGVDYVKFQAAIPELVASVFAEKADYQKNTTGEGENQLEMIRRITLSFSEQRQLMEYCEEVGVNYLCTPFDLPSIDFLDNCGIALWKIPSGEITNFPYLRRIGQTQKPIILSTGMANILEIHAAIKVLVEYGTLRDNIVLLHCTTEYPAPKDEVNLRAMETMRKEFGLEVGYSDHTEGLEISIAAVAMGACVIEKHFTLDRSMEGPDHKASIEPDELIEMVKDIRCVEKALGNGIKEVCKAEKKNIKIARKSIVAACQISKGMRLTEENLIVKRPANGISPMEWENVIGTLAIRDFTEDEPIEL